MHDNASELQNEALGIFFFFLIRGFFGNKYYLTNLFLETYNYDGWFKYEEEFTDLLSMPPLEDDKKVLPMPPLGDDKDVSPIPPVKEEKAEGKGLEI